MKHRLLILGTLGEFVQLVKKSKERGHYTIVCDGYPDGPARQYADASYVIPVTDIDAVAELCQKEKVDGIITSFSDLLMECMVKIAEKAGLPCYLKPEQLSWYRDKSACRDVLDKLGLPAPGFRKISVELLKQGSEEEIQQSIANLQYPLISKPLDKYGSRGIFIIKDQEQLAGSVRKTAEFTDLDEILIEEYNDGFEFNMMTWVSDGAVRVISIADREKTQFAERGNASAQYTKCLSIPFPGGGRKKCHRYSAELYQLYRTDGRCIIHAVFLESRRGNPGL